MASKRGVTWQQVVEIATAFPGVVEKSSYGTPALYAGTKFMARLREPGVIVLKPIEDDEQQFLMETAPDAFFTTDHYRGYPTILIRLPKVRSAQLADLIEQSWRRLATKKHLTEFDAAPRPRVPAKKAIPSPLPAGPKSSRGRGVAWQQVAEIALALPGAATYPPGDPDSRDVRVGKKHLVFISSREPGALCIRPVHEDEQQFLMETQPATYFLTDHYRGWDCILVHMDKARKTDIAELIEQAWRRIAPKRDVNQLFGIADKLRARRTKTDGRR